MHEGLMKRFLDFLLSLFGLIVLSPVLLVFMALIFLQDRSSPIYSAPRVGLYSKDFKMVKLRSMIVNADNSKVDSTSSDDQRITKVGATIRKYKLDEFTQLWNVLKGEMSLVGPRPNVRRDVDLYSDVEFQLLEAKPGITDFSSIIFSDEGDILAGYEDPDLMYNQLIRPWKSRLGILYIKNKSIKLDLFLIFLTGLAIINKEKALLILNKKIIRSLTDNEELIEVCLRKQSLKPSIPPGMNEIVSSR
jgi:lipopolysaccharide/colanic/teichoic acid biosynthesis glycosyltransferase